MVGPFTYVHNIIQEQHTDTTYWKILQESKMKETEKNYKKKCSHDEIITAFKRMDAI